MKRSNWKGPYVPWSLFRWIKQQNKNKRPKKVWSRRATILPSFVGRTFLIHSGHQFKRVTISSEIVNHRFGEFAPTRRRRSINKLRKR
jgi:small subunit ribosomal protein S19